MSAGALRRRNQQVTDGRVLDGDRAVQECLPALRRREVIVPAPRMVLEPSLMEAEHSRERVELPPFDRQEVAPPVPQSPDPRCAVEHVGAHRIDIDGHGRTPELSCGGWCGVGLVTHSSALAAAEVAP